MPRTPKRDRTLSRAARAWHLRAQSLTHQQIADEMGVGRSTVSKLLAGTADMVVATMKENALRVKAEQVSQHEHIVAEAMAAWEASKKAKGVRTVKQSTTPATAPGKPPTVVSEETTTRAENQTGDPRYLTVAMAGLDAVRKLLGIDAPMKVANTDPEGNPAPLPAPQEPDASTDARTVVRIAALLDAARARRDEAVARPSGRGAGGDDLSVVGGDPQPRDGQVV